MIKCNVQKLDLEYNFSNIKKFNCNYIQPYNELHVIYANNYYVRRKNESQLDDWH